MGKRENTIVFLIIFFAVFLRLINLDQSLWLDEATQAILSQGSVYSIIFERGVDFHPPFSYLILHFWIKMGTSEIWLRMLSVIFGVGTVWIAYKLTKVLFNKKIALLSTILLTVNHYHIYYSQEVRMYAQATFFGVLSIYFFHRSIKNPKSIYFAGYILSTAALLYTHYDGFFLVFAQIFYLLLKEKEKFKNFVLNLLIIFLTYIPWIPQFLIQFQNGLMANEYLPGWRDVLSMPFYKAIPLIFIKFSFGRINLEENIVHILLALSILFITTFLIFKSKEFKNDKNYSLVLFWFFIPIILSLIISFKIPLNQPFRLLYVIPAFSILLSLGILSMGKAKIFFIGGILAISLSGLILYYGDSKYQREDWRGATRFIVENSDDDTQVIFAWPQPFPPFKWYAKDNLGMGVVSKFPAEIAAVEGNLESIRNKNKIYVFEYLQDLSDPKRVIQKIIEENRFKKINVYNFNGVGFIDYYVRKN